MNKHITPAGQKLFDEIKHLSDKGEEYWLAREFAKLLDYSWEGFERLLTRARISIEQSGMSVDNHIRHVSKMVIVGYGNARPTNDFALTRHACYVIAQNGNASKKPQIATAQAYFAIQTRRQEVSDQHNKDFKRLVARKTYSESDKRLTTAILEKDMDETAVPVIKNAGDTKLFGGKTNKEMKAHYGITNPKKPLADRAPNVILAAKSLANEMTAHNLEQYPIDTFEDIKSENETNNDEVRQTLIRRGITPEALPPAEDTEVVMKRFQQVENLKLED